MHLRPRTPLEELIQCSSDPLAGFRGEDRMGRKKGEAGKRKGRGREGRKRDGGEGRGCAAVKKSFKALQFL